MGVRLCEEGNLSLQGFNGIRGDISVSNDIGTPSFVAGTQNVYYAGMEVEFDLTESIICKCGGFTPKKTKHVKNNSAFYPAKP